MPGGSHAGATRGRGSVPSHSPLGPSASGLAVAALAACVVACLRPAAAVTYPPRFDTTTISSAPNVRTVWAGDVDGDGLTDVASATERDLVTWYKNGGVFALDSTPAMC